VIFESDSRIREIRAFDDCQSLPEIEIPTSVEILGEFDGCAKLKKITFAPICRLHVIEGFEDSVIRAIEIPASVESVIGFNRRCLSQLIFAEGTVIKRIKVGNRQKSKQRYSRPVFVTYGKEDLRKSRWSRVHPGIRIVSLPIRPPFT
jgi:hypothetical protein